MQNNTLPERLAFRILNNSAAIIGGEFFYHFVNFLAGILIARSLGSESYGIFSFIFVYLSFFEMFIQFGMNTILAREITHQEQEAPKILGAALWLRLIFIAAAVPFALVIIKFLGYGLHVEQAVFLASFQLFLGIRSIYEVIFRVRLAMIYPVIFNSLRAVINLILISSVLVMKPSLLLIIACYLASGAAGLAGLAACSRRFTAVDMRWNAPLIKRILSESAPLLVSGYLTLLYYRIDILMLSKMKDFADVGYYSAATRFTEALDIISAALMLSLFPALSRAFKESRGDFEALIRKAVRVLLLAGLPVALGGTFVARDLMTLVFGSEYARSYLTLTILFWYTFVGFFSTLLVNVLIIAGKQAVDIWVSSALVFLNIGMNLVLIPSYTYDGAAAATVMTEIFGVLFMLIFAVRHRDILMPLPRREAAAAFKMNGIFLIFLLALKSIERLPFLGFVALSAGMYAVLLFSWRIVSFSDCRSYVSYLLKREAAEKARP